MVQFYKQTIKIRALIIILLLMFISGCRNYYKTLEYNYSASGFNEVVDQLHEQKRNYIIAHVNGNQYHLFNVELNEGDLFSADYESVASIHKLFINKGKKGRYRNKRGENVVLNEIHIFLKSYKDISLDHLKFLPSDIERIVIIKKDNLRSISSHFLPVILITSLIIFGKDFSCCGSY